MTLVILLDQLSKALAFIDAPTFIYASNIEGAHPDVVSLGAIAFKAQINWQGNIGTALPFSSRGFGVLALMVAAVLIFLSRRLASPRRSIPVAFLAGGVGSNGLDRVVLGGVRDFVQLLPDVALPLGLSWPSGHEAALPFVFNLADVSLVLGFLGLAWSVLDSTPVPRDRPCLDG